MAALAVGLGFTLGITLGFTLCITLCITLALAFCVSGLFAAAAGNLRQQLQHGTPGGLARGLVLGLPCLRRGIGGTVSQAGIEAQPQLLALAPRHARCQRHLAVGVRHAVGCLGRGLGLALAAPPAAQPRQEIAAGRLALAQRRADFPVTRVEGVHAVPALCIDRSVEDLPCCGVKRGARAASRRRWPRAAPAGPGSAAPRRRHGRAPAVPRAGAADGSSSSPRRLQGRVP
ncbi:hypothetical protein D3C81_931940 [compost metagenome]